MYLYFESKLLALFAERRRYIFIIIIILLSLLLASDRHVSDHFASVG